MRDVLTSPVRITVGQGNAANEDIKQVAGHCNAVHCVCGKLVRC